MNESSDSFDVSPCQWALGDGVATVSGMNRSKLAPTMIAVLVLVLLGMSFSTAARARDCWDSCHVDRTGGGGGGCTAASAEEKEQESKCVSTCNARNQWHPPPASEGSQSSPVPGCTTPPDVTWNECQGEMCPAVEPPTQGMSCTRAAECASVDCVWSGFDAAFHPVLPATELDGGAEADAEPNADAGDEPVKAARRSARACSSCRCSSPAETCARLTWER
jgi:hypothetical protein